MAANGTGKSAKNQRILAPVDLQRPSELDYILNDLLRDTPAEEASVRERTLANSWGAREREFSAPQGCVTTQSGGNQTVLTWQTSREGPRKCVTVSKETIKRPSASGAFQHQTGSARQDAFPVRFTDERSLLDAVDARRFQGPPSYQESRTLQTHSETKTQERMLSPVFRRPVSTDPSRGPPGASPRQRVFSPEIMSDGTVLSRSDYYSPSQGFSLPPQKRSASSHRNYASDSEEALTWLEEQRRKLEQKRASGRTLNYRQQQRHVGDRSKSSTDFTRTYPSRPALPQDDLVGSKSRIPTLKNSHSVDSLTPGKSRGYSRTLEPPRFTKDYGGDFSRFKTVESRWRSDAVDNRGPRDDRFNRVASIQRPSSATPHTKYSFTMPGVSSYDEPWRRAPSGLSAPTSPVIPARGISSRDAVVRSKGKASEWLGVTENTAYNTLDSAEELLRKASGVHLTAPLKPVPTETELISLRPIGPGVQDLEPDGTIDGTLNFRQSNPTLNQTNRGDFTRKSQELRSQSSLGRLTQAVSPSMQRRDLGYGTMPTSTGHVSALSGSAAFAPVQRPLTALGPAPSGNDPGTYPGTYQAQRRIYSAETVHGTPGQPGYDVQQTSHAWSSTGQQALNKQWLQQQPLSQQQQQQQQQFSQQETIYRQQVQQQQQFQRQEQQQQLLLQEQQRVLQQQQNEQRQLQLQEQQRQLQLQEQQKQLQLQEQQFQLQLQEQQRLLQQKQEEQRQLQLQEQQRQLQQQQEEQRQLQLLEQQRQLQLQEQQRQLQQQLEQQRQLQLQEQQRLLQVQQEEQRLLQLQEQQRQLQLQQEEQRLLQLQEQQRQLQQQQEQQRQLQLQEQQRLLQQQQEEQKQLQLQEQQRLLQQQQEQQRQLQQQQEQQRQLQLQEQQKQLLIQEQKMQLQLQEQQRQLQQQQEQQRQLQQQQYHSQTIQRTYVMEHKTEPRHPAASSQTLDSRLKETSFSSAQPVTQFASQEVFRETSFVEPHRSTRSDGVVQVNSSRWNEAGNVALSTQNTSLQSGSGAQAVEVHGVGLNQLGGGQVGINQVGTSQAVGQVGVNQVATSQAVGQVGVNHAGGQVIEQRYVVERQVIGRGSQPGDQANIGQLGGQVGINQFGTQVGIQPIGGQVGVNQAGTQVIEQRYVVERQVIGKNQRGQQAGSNLVQGQVGTNLLQGQVDVNQAGGQSTLAVGAGQGLYQTAHQSGTQAGTQLGSTHQTGTADNNTWVQSTSTQYGTQSAHQAGAAYQQQHGVRLGSDEIDTGGDSKVLLSSPRGSERVEVMSTMTSGQQNHLQQQQQQQQQHQQQQQSYAYGFQQVGERSDGAEWTQKGGMNDGSSASYQAMGSINPGGSWTLRPEVTRSGGHQRNASGSFVDRQVSPRFGLGRARTASATCIADGAEWSHQPPRFVRDTSKYWHKPNFSRDDAINLLLDKEPGSFVVRNSSTFPGSFGLALKVSQVPPNMQTKGGDPQVDLIRHFLIEPTPKGVRLKGCSNEPVFASLAALIYQHSITPLSLPCRLKLPDDEIDVLDSSLLLSGSESNSQLNACTVLYMSSVETENLTGPEALARSIKELFESGRPLPRSTIVQFKATRDGITLTDNRRRIFFRRFYPIQTITFCGVDPRDRRWTVRSEDLTISGKAFGFVARKPGVARENACHVFLELDSTQPANIIVNQVTKILIGQGQRLLQ